jgi:hypothetical protein
VTADNAAHGIDEIDPGTNGVALKIKNSPHLQLTKVMKIL